MQFTVNSALWRQVFAVPSEITDRHIRMCSGVALKCLLLLLRDPDAFGDPKAIADRLGQPVSEISDAISAARAKGLKKQEIIDILNEIYTQEEES